VQLARNASAKGVMVLNAGALTANEITTGNTGSTQRELDFNGGTLVAGANNANYIHDLSLASVQSGGAVFNTAGFTVGVTQPLVDGGGGALTKNGNGTLLLNGANTYTGNTTINGGFLGGAGSIAGNLIANSGAGVAPGNAGSTPLAVNGNITLNAGSTNVFAVNGSTPANDKVAAGASVAYGGILKIVPTGSFTVGQQFQLFSGTGATNASNFASVQSTVPTTTFSFANGILTVLTAGPDLTKNHLTNSVSGSTLSLSWSAGWKLQAQTNSLSKGLGTNWVYITDGTSTSTNVSIIPSNPTVFYRLVSQ
jgi:autotransporter-associated beta strand protein